MWYWRYNVLRLSRDFPRPRDQRVMWLYRWKPLIVSYHPVMFGGHRHCGSGYINISANTVILPQMQEIRCCICPLPSAIIIFCKAYDMSFATHVSKKKLRNNFYGNFFSVSNEISRIMVTRFLGNE